jgi:hypothetical protein
MKNLILFIVIYCSANILHSQKYSHYYKSINYGDDIKTDDILEVNVAVVPIPEKPQTEEEVKTFFDLRDSIPIAFLKAISLKATNTNDIIEAIKSPLSNPKVSKVKRPSSIDKTEFQVRIIFSNIKKYYKKKEFYHPNNRLEILNTKVSIPDTLFYFKNIDRLENETDFIDFGTIERNNKITFGANLTGNLGVNTVGESAFSDSSEFSSPSESSLSIGENQIGNHKKSSNNKTTTTAGYGANAGVNYGLENNIKENLNVKLRRLKTGFTFSPEVFLLSQHGSVMNDVFDNAVVTLTIKYKHEKNIEYKTLTHFDNLFKPDGTINKPDDIKIGFQGFNYISCKNASNLNLTFSTEGLMRSVKKGSSFLEHDDRIYYHELLPSNNKSIEVQKFDYCDDVYQIGIHDKLTNRKYYLKVEDGIQKICFFRNDNSSLKMIQWLKEAIEKTETTPGFLNSSLKLYFSTGEGSYIIPITNNQNPIDLINLLKNGTLENIKL